MKLTKQQQNCPYCHVGSNLKGRYNHPVSPWEDGELSLEDVISPQVSVGEDTWGEIDFDPERAVLTSWGEGTDPLVVQINFCPFCGRPLRGDN